MGWLKTKISEKKEQFKEDWKQKSEAQKQSRALARQEYFKTREQERIRLARFKAQQEALARERKIKAKYAPRKPMNFSFGMQPQVKGKTQQPRSSFLSMQPSSVMSPSYFASSKPSVKPKVSVKRRKKSRKKSQPKSKYIIRGGKAYKVA